MATNDTFQDKQCSGNLEEKNVKLMEESKKDVPQSWASSSYSARGNAVLKMENNHKFRDKQCSGNDQEQNVKLMKECKKDVLESCESARGNLVLKENVHAIWLKLKVVMGNDKGEKLWRKCNAAKEKVTGLSVLFEIKKEEQLYHLYVTRVLLRELEMQLNILYSQMIEADVLKDMKKYDDNMKSYFVRGNIRTLLKVMLDNLSWLLKSKDGLLANIDIKEYIGEYLHKLEEDVDFILEMSKKTIENRQIMVQHATKLKRQIDVVKESYESLSSLMAKVKGLNDQ